MATYNMSKDMPENTLDLMLWRARSIEKYAQVEQSMCMLFSNLINSTPNVAAIIFFRITSKRASHAIIEDLLAERLGETYRHYWHGIPNTPNKQGLMSLVKSLDQRRNEIVHWHTSTNVVFEDDQAKAHNTLVKPNFWSRKSDILHVTVEDMIEFAEKADFVERSINSFCIRVFHPKSSEMAGAETWREILQQPCTYPIPDTHPLYSKPQAHGSQPPPSQA